MQRFIAMHTTESGFSSAKEVQDWIYATRESASSWRVVGILVDKVTQDLAINEQEIALKQAYTKGVEDEKQRMRLLLCLT